MRVAVLGAGVIGVTSAWYLARAGHEVTLLERHGAAAMETSFANGGQVSAGHAEPWARPSVVPKLARWIGREDAPLLFRLRADRAQWEWGARFLLECLTGRFEANSRQLAGLARYSHACLRALRAETALDYDQIERGILQFCTDTADFDDLAAHAEAARGFGVQREVMSAAQCLALEPALAASALPVMGGVYSPHDESGDARAFTQRLLALARSRGVNFVAGAHVAALEEEGGRVRRVRLRDGELSADAYVVALGSYSPLLLHPLGIRLPVYPLKGYSVTIPLDGALEDAAPTVSLTDEARKIVISRLGKRLRAAGTAELAGYDTRINAVRCAAIMTRIGQLFPGIAAAPGVEYWAGLRPATPSNVPIIGRAKLSNLYLNTGHGTLGWTLACGSGRALADLVSGRKPEVDFRFR